MAGYLTCADGSSASFTADAATPLLSHALHRQRSQAMDAATPPRSPHTPPHYMSSSSSPSSSSSSPFASVASIPPHPSSASLPPSAFTPAPLPPITPSTRWMDLWPGHHVFLCRGRCVLGSNPLLFAATLVLTVSLPAVYLWFVAPHFSLAFLVPLLALVPLTLLAFLFAALSDPGIVPPSLSPHTSLPPPPASPHGSLSPSGLPRPYCPYCRLYRPARCKHCKYCNVCVEEFDHHCPYIGQCVGRRNYRYYLAYIALLTALCPYMSALTLRFVWDAVAGGERFASAQVLGGLALGAFLALTAVFALSLSTYHAHLLWVGSTTNEEVRGVWEGRPRVYDRGCAGNVWRATCEAGDDGSALLAYVSEKVGSEERMGTEEERRWEEGERRRREREERDLRKAAEHRRRHSPRAAVASLTPDHKHGSDAHGHVPLDQRLLPAIV